MKPQTALNWLFWLIAGLALAAALAGLFWQPDGPGQPYAFTTLYGQSVTLYGQGLYQHDTLFIGAGFKGMDVVTLVVSVPFLTLAFRRYRQDPLRGSLLLAGALAYFVYIGASLTFSAAFNRLFLIYTALFSASLFALIIVLVSAELPELARHVSPALPRRGLALFLVIAGLGTLFLWLSDLVGPLLTGRAPELLGPYTTMFTHGFDSAVITPAGVVSAVYVLRHKPVGYLLAAPLLILCTLNGVVVIASTVSQTLAGITFPIGVYVGMVGSWVVMGAFAVWLTIVFFRCLSEPAAALATSRRPVHA